MRQPGADTDIMPGFQSERKKLINGPVFTENKQRLAEKTGDIVMAVGLECTGKHRVPGVGCHAKQAGQDQRLHGADILSSRFKQVFVIIEGPPAWRGA